jgi:predicted kinase
VSDNAVPGPLLVITGPTGVGKTTVSRLVAATFERSVHLKGDEFMAAVVSGWVDPNLAEANEQNHAVGAAIATSAMSFAQEGYTTVVDGYLFPEGVAGLALACTGRGLACHYAVLAADLETCWDRASARPEGRWPLEREPVAALHARFAALAVDPRHVFDASGSPESVRDAVLRAFDDGRLAVT